MAEAQEEESLGDRPGWSIELEELEIGPVIAEGGYGIVHRGRYQRRKVAVKILTLMGSAAEEDARRFQKQLKLEINLSSKLKHPNIVEFVGALVAPPRPLIVTEFMPGGTLKDFLLKQKKRLALARAITLALDAARGMNYLHENGIIHRDLKSPNLLVDKDGTLKVTDFGLARREALNAASMTAETGTIRWMAPEMITHKPYSKSVDVYSFGIVLWEIASGKFPFQGMSFVQLAHAIPQGFRPPVDCCIKELVELMKQCWDSDPRVRPGFKEIVKRLEGMLDTCSNSNKSSINAARGTATKEKAEPASGAELKSDGSSCFDTTSVESRSQHGPHGSLTCCLKCTIL